MNNKINKAYQFRSRLDLIHFVLEMEAIMHRYNFSYRYEINDTEVIVEFYHNDEHWTEDLHFAADAIENLYYVKYKI